MKQTDEKGNALTYWGGLEKHNQDMKQTAIDFLYERLERMIPRTALYNIDKEEYFKQAKEMEKQQIIDANREGVYMVIDNVPYITGEQYYNETFKNK